MSIPSFWGKPERAPAPPPPSAWTPQPPPRPEGAAAVVGREWSIDELDMLRVPAGSTELVWVVLRYYGEPRPHGATYAWLSTTSNATEARYAPPVLDGTSRLGVSISDLAPGQYSLSVVAPGGTILRGPTLRVV